jgi:hypothetical protein
MLPAQAVLTQTPCHHSAQFLGIYNFFEFASNQLRGVPSPEKTGLLVPVVLPARLLVRLAALDSATPRVDDRDALALAIVGETASLAEVVARTAD